MAGLCLQLPVAKVGHWQETIRFLCRERGLAPVTSHLELSSNQIPAIIPSDSRSRERLGLPVLHRHNQRRHTFPSPGQAHRHPDSRAARILQTLEHFSTGFLVTPPFPPTRLRSIFAQPVLFGRSSLSLTLAFIRCSITPAVLRPSCRGPVCSLPRETHPGLIVGVINTIKYADPPQASRKMSTARRRR